jgi:anti-sigma-K factor RskA
MTDTTFRPEEEDDLLAAEYVSGLLELEERVAVETRARNDVAFAARITDWENRLSDLNEDFPEVPAPDLLPLIESRLFPSAPRRSLWSNFWAWGAAATAALALVAYLALTPAAPSFTATLAADGGTLRYEAVITQDKLTITRVSGDAPDAAHSHELWLIAGDNPPVSLGVIPGDHETISLPGVQAGEILAITVEQLGGSPTGKPTTTPVAVGKLTAA